MRKIYPSVSEEYKKAVDKAKMKFRGFLSDNYLAPPMLRLAYRHALAFHVNTETSALIGSEDAVAKQAFELCVKLVEHLKGLFPVISYADLYQLAGVIAVEVTGGPVMLFHPGREDKKVPLVEGPLPKKTKRGNQLSATLGEVDFVTLSGGYDLGNLYKPEGPPARWRPNLLFTNGFFKNLLVCERDGKLPPQKYMPLHEDPVFRRIMPLACQNEGIQPSSPTYIPLLEDPVLRRLVEKYAADEDDYFADYAVSHMKLSELGFADASPNLEEVPLPHLVEPCCRFNNTRKIYPIVSEEYKKAVDKARMKIRGLITVGRSAVVMLHLAWHSAATYDVKTNTGGPFGTMRFKAEQSHDSNMGLEFVVNQLEHFKNQLPIISYADLYQLSGVIAVEVAGGPIITFHPGREDKDEPPAEGRLPDEMKGGNHLRDVFVKTMGLDDVDIVTLSGGYHLGRVWEDQKKFGFSYPWCPKLVFDNSYFKNLLACEKKGIMPPLTYIPLLEDPVFRRLVEKYAADEDAFFADYAVSHMKLSELG